jgi:hypothetical protein
VQTPPLLRGACRPDGVAASYSVRASSPQTNSGSPSTSLALSTDWLALPVASGLVPMTQLFCNSWEHVLGGTLDEPVARR